MSAELYTASGPGGKNLQGTTVGGSKPLHRFIKGQPKITGVSRIHTHIHAQIIICQILIDYYVTVSLALSIVTILGTCWTLLHILPELGHSHYYRYYEFIEENMTEIDDAAMGVTIEAIFVFYSFVGGIIFIVMSTLAGAALRSTKSQVKKTRLYTTDTAENCAFHNIC
uniref:Uncharacterized protein n=1 Tax=Lates calcarifer TaxID=8187 RepID=A0A4W6FV35_LATCA